MVEQIQEILDRVLPASFLKIAEQGKGVFGGNYIKIGMAVSEETINKVRGQHIQLCTLNLDLDNMELDTQIFGGNGGGRIYRKPDPNHPKEKFYAMVGIKIPFRKPKKTEEAVLKAVERFAERYLQALKDNKDVLMYDNRVNYDEILSK